MKLCLLISFLLSSFLSYATEIKEHVVRHNSVQKHLMASDQSAIEQMINSCSNCFIEKVNVQSYSLDFVDEIQNQILSEDRLDYIYSFLTELMEDENNIELINMNRNSVIPRDFRSYSLIKIYFVDSGNETPIPGIEKVLFPEEFEEKAPTYIPIEFKANTSFKIEDINFHGNSALYIEDSEVSLEKLYEFLRDNPKVKIRIEGHVNGKLSKTYLKEAGKNNPEKRVYESSRHLSLERARSVKFYLTEKGIGFNRIETIGKGADQMIYKKPKNRKQEEANRRIEVIIVES